MAETLAEILSVVVFIYAIVGAAFGVYFVIRGAGRVDPVARDGTWGFRILIYPGAAALWPLLLQRLLTQRSTPEERTAHRLAAAARDDSVAS